MKPRPAARVNSFGHCRNGRFGVIGKCHPNVPHHDLPDLLLRESVDPGGSCVTAAAVNMFKCQPPNLRRPRIDRHQLAVLDVAAVTVGIAVIERVDYHRCQNIVHLDVSECDVIDNGIPAASAAGLDAKSAVRAVEYAALDQHIFRAAGNLGADCDRAVPAP